MLKCRLDFFSFLAACVCFAPFYCCFLFGAHVDFKVFNVVNIQSINPDSVFDVYSFCNPRFDDIRTSIMSSGLIYLKWPPEQIK